MEPFINCSRCDRQIPIVRWQAGNGRTHIRAWCDYCERWHIFKAGGVNLPKASFIAQWDMMPALLPVKVSEPFGYKNVCVVSGCDETLGEWHHILPRHLSLEADNWPMVWLCTPHHVEWHRRVTPDMSRRYR